MSACEADPGPWSAVAETGKVPAAGGLGQRRVAGACLVRACWVGGTRQHATRQGDVNSMDRDGDRPSAFRHQPVLVQELLLQFEAARPEVGREIGRIVDCTVGGGGHAKAVLDRFPRAHLIGLDRDVDAVAAARQSLAPFGDRVEIVHARFSELKQVLASRDIGLVDIVLVDLGVSSHQLDTPERGFSFRTAGPLDMRMDQSRGAPVWEIIAQLGERELANAIRRYGEERQALRVARAIRKVLPKTTEQLADVVRAVVRRDVSGIDAATRTFQALRMLANDELGELERWLEQVPSLLCDGGLVAAISFHSLEDRAVKQSFRRAARDCVCPPGLPVCACTQRAVLEVRTRRVVQASAEEMAANPRARSAKLRVARRLRRQP